LDKIQDSLAKSKSNLAVVPPSSPPLSRENLPADRSPSPRERKLHAVGGPHIPRVAMGESDVDRSCETRQKIKTPSSSSEFGDDDFDQDLLALVGSSSDQLEDSAKPERVMAHVSIDKPGYNPDNSPCPAEHVNEKKLINPSTNIQNDDEFDDDDDFPESMEDLLAQYDEKTPAQQSKSSPQRVLGIQEFGQFHGRKSGVSDQPELLKGPEEGTSGDEFDDDDFDVSAIENTMLQSGMDSRNQVGYP
jgi:DNA replication ATP-dependent helicase Dna2